MSQQDKRPGGTPAEQPATGTQPPQGQRNPADRQPGEGTEPRAGERLEPHSSQGLAGAQGSGGGAERGIRQAPHEAPQSSRRAGVPPPAPPADSDDPARRGDIDR